MGGILLIGLVGFAGWHLYRYKAGQKKADFIAEPPAPLRGAELAEKVALALLAQDKECFLAALRDLRLVGFEEELTLKTASQRLTPGLLVCLLSRYCWWCWVGLSEFYLNEQSALAARQLTGEFKNHETLEGVMDALCQSCRFGERIKAAIRRREYLPPAQIAVEEEARRRFEEAINR